MRVAVEVLAGSKAAYSYQDVLPLTLWKPDEEGTANSLLGHSLPHSCVEAKHYLLAGQWSPGALVHNEGAIRTNSL